MVALSNDYLENVLGIPYAHDPKNTYIYIHTHTVIQKISVYAKIQTTNFSAPVVVKAGSN